jgi:SanA protein
MTFLFLIIGLNTWMIISTKDKIYDSLEDVPYNEVGLVLGTSNRNQKGEENKFFKERMFTAAKLLKAGKVNKLIVSGDNRSKYYNEPVMMQDALINLGVPKDKIFIDAGGFRTIESIKNMKEDFGLTNVTIITQEFHGYRALFICNYYDVEAQVMGTKRLSFKESGHVRLREFFARIKAFTDLYIFEKQSGLQLNNFIALILI